MRARKRFGQHFLEPAWTEKMVAAIAPRTEDVFLEIGPGRGALTVPLAKRCRMVVAVEIDRDLAAAATEWAPPNVRIVEGDALEDLESVLASLPVPVRAVGNLPYNVASPILGRLFSAAAEGRRITDATVMLQKEVADRVVASPGTGDYGSLAIQAALVSDTERVLTLPPGAFRPAPSVVSAVVRLRFRPLRVDVGDRAIFDDVVHGVFQHRRKTLANSLKWVAPRLGRSIPDVLARAGIDGGRRPEEISVAEFARLSRAVL